MSAQRSTRFSVAVAVALGAAVLFLIGCAQKEEPAPPATGTARSLPGDATGLPSQLPSASAEGRRIALIVGNSAYADSPLANPANDAVLIAETLQQVGFEVSLQTDSDQKAMKRSIQEFGATLEQAGPSAVGLFYYAGHGVQMNGRNYLIPVGAAIARDADVEIEAVSADWVLEQMRFARNRLNFVILDACRNNPFARSFRSVDRGLAKMDAPAGVLIAYATAPGDVAVDGVGRDNSPYTDALARSIRASDQPAELMFKQTRDVVRRSTNERQTPWESSSLTGQNFYFAQRGGAVSPAPTAAAPAPSPAPVAAANRPGQPRAEAPLPAATPAPATTAEATAAAQVVGPPGADPAGPTAVGSSPSVGKPWPQVEAVFTATDGTTTRVRAETVSFCISVGWSITLDSGQDILFEKMRRLDVLRSDPALSSGAKATVRVTLLSGSVLEGTMDAGCDFAGTTEAGRYRVYPDKLARLEFER